MMNKTELKVYKKVIHKVCEKFDGAEEFIKEKRNLFSGKVIGGRGNLFSL